MVDSLEKAPLGKKSAYVCHYDPSLLFAIARRLKRDEIKVPQPLPFYGYDTWNAFEVSWLNSKGKPQVAIVQFDIDCHSQNIIESKSFKLYLNSFNNTQFTSCEAVKVLLERDIAAAVMGDVRVIFHDVEDSASYCLETFSGHLIDELDVACDCYTVNPALLSADTTNFVEEKLYSNLLKSNCLVTGQPDWGSVEIHYQGPQIKRESLLQYIVSLRNHNEFHEQCVERIFMDIQACCQPSHLTVHARYTRRGGLDINPIRSSQKMAVPKNIRLPRQ